jgi:hypothetical protein
MAVLTNNFEGGTDGVAVSVANSGGASGTPFSAIFGTGLTFEDTAAFQGSMGARVVGSAFGAGQITVSTTTLAAKMYFRTPTSPAISTDMYLIRMHNGATRLASVHMNTAGKLRVADASGTSGIFTTTTVLAANTWYRIELYAVAGATTTTGTIRFAFYLGNSSTPVETQYNNTAANVGTAVAFTTLYMGKYSAGTEQYDFDAFSWDSAATGLIGVAAGSAPTVSQPANQNVAAAAAVSVAVTASSGSGTITSYAWSYVYPTSGGPTLSGTTTNTVSFTAGSAGALYILQCVVTDSNGLTTTITAEVRVPSSGDVTALPGPSSASAGTWSNVGGAASSGAALGDTSDTTYVESATLNATPATIRFRLQPMTARSAFTVNARLAQDVSGAATAKVRLYEGATLRQEWTQAITTSFADYPLVVTTPANITDWGSLYLEFVGTAP